MDKLLLEKRSLAGISRVLNRSETWLQNYVNQKYKQVPKRMMRSPHSLLKIEDEVIIECDELCSFNKKTGKTMGLVSHE